MDKDSAEYYDRIERELYSCVIADVMDGLGYWQQVMSHEIRPIYAEAKIVGRAATMLAAEVYEVPAEPFKLELELLDDLRPGAVICCTQQGSTKAAIWGELLSTHAQAKGARGAIMDGLSRDSWGIIDLRFPVFARGLSPADSKGRLDVIATHVPIEMGGVRVHDGDLVICDHDGCVAVPQAIEEEVLELAFKKVEGENEVREALRQGMSIQQMFKEYGIL